MESQAKVHTSAVVIIPPQEKCDKIQEIRKEHDKAFDRWMPHINLLYPFVPEDQFQAAAEKAIKSLNQTPLDPFAIKFEKLGYFSHGKNCTLFLKPSTESMQMSWADEPSNAVTILQSILQRAFPHCDDLSTMSSAGFQPHLTIGQFSSMKEEIEAAVAKYQLWFDWNPIEFTLDTIHFISRKGEDPFTSKVQVNLQGGSIVPVEDKGNQKTADPQNEIFQLKSQTEIIEKVKKWMTERSKANNLPKTVEKLEHAMRRMCEQTCKVNVDVVLNLLSSQGIIASTFENGKKTVKYPKPTSGSASGIDISSVKGLSEQDEKELKKVMQKVTIWMSKINPKPTNYETLKKSLMQVCKFKRSLDTADVIDRLQKQGILDVGTDGSVKFKA